MKKAALFVLFFQCIFGGLHGHTVVCVHGILDTTQSFKMARIALGYYGYDVLMWDYPIRKKYIEEHACDLVECLKRLACDAPGQPIYFLAHSTGGVVVRAAINHPACPNEAKIGKAILCAPPNRGSLLARRCNWIPPVRWALGDKSGWQLMHYTPEQFAAFGTFPASMQVLVIAGTLGSTLWSQEPNDGFLTVQETWLDTPFTFVHFPFSHGALLKRTQVVKSITDFLLQPPQCDCPSPL